MGFKIVRPSHMDLMSEEPLAYKTRHTPLTQPSLKPHGWYWWKGKSGRVHVDGAPEPEAWTVVHCWIASDTGKYMAAGPHFPEPLTQEYMTETGAWGAPIDMSPPKNQHLSYLLHQINSDAHFLNLNWLKEQNSMAGHVLARIRANTSEALKSFPQERVEPQETSAVEWHNPEGVDADQVPEGFRFLKVDEVDGEYHIGSRFYDNGDWSMLPKSEGYGTEYLKGDTVIRPDPMPRFSWTVEYTVETEGQKPRTHKTIVWLKLDTVQGVEKACMTDGILAAAITSSEKLTKVKVKNGRLSAFNKK